MKRDIEKYLDLISNPESLDMPIANCHIPGLFSLVFKGRKPGTLIRAFISENGIEKGELALHTHKYDLEITTLTHGIEHTKAQKILPSTPLTGIDSVISISEYIYSKKDTLEKSFEYQGDCNLKLSTVNLPLGSQINLNNSAIHSISCEPGSIWIVEELGLISDHSYYYGVPYFEDDMLYQTPYEISIDAALKIVTYCLSSLNERYNYGSKHSTLNNELESELELEPGDFGFSPERMRCSVIEFPKKENDNER